MNGGWIAAVVVLAGCTSSVKGTGSPAPGGSATASGGPSSSGAPACAAVAGHWQLRGLCGGDQCEIQQTGCDLEIACTGGGSYSGSVTTSTIIYSGARPDGVNVTCTATLGPESLHADGRCNPDRGLTCTFNASKE